MSPDTPTTPDVEPSATSGYPHRRMSASPSTSATALNSIRSRSPPLNGTVSVRSLNMRWFWDVAFGVMYPSTVSVVQFDGRDTFTSRIGSTVARFAKSPTAMDDAEIEPALNRSASMNPDVILPASRFAITALSTTVETHTTPFQRHCETTRPPLPMLDMRNHVSSTTPSYSFGGVEVDQWTVFLPFADWRTESMSDSSSSCASRIAC